MTPLESAVVAFFCSVVAGFLGSLLGVGGGIIVVPSLTLLLGVPIRFAIGASIVSVIATSSGAAVAYVRKHLSNIRVGMLLEVTTTAGALAGAFLAGRIGGGVLHIIFACVMIYTAVSMLRFNHAEGRADGVPDRLADRLALHGSFHDESTVRASPATQGIEATRQQGTETLGSKTARDAKILNASSTGSEVSYRVRRTPSGLALSLAAGVISGLLGVGGGIIKVPTMNLVMGMPLKVASATSNFMIGVTGAASAGVYFARGDVNPFVTGPVALGVLLGSTIGSGMLGRISSSVLRMAFVLLLLWVAIQMFMKGI